MDGLIVALGRGGYDHLRVPHRGHWCDDFRGQYRWPTGPHCFRLHLCVFLSLSLTHYSSWNSLELTSRCSNVVAVPFCSPTPVSTPSVVVIPPFHVPTPGSQLPFLSSVPRFDRYCLLRCDLGSHRMGRNRRDLSFTNPCQSHVPLRRFQLALELWYRIRYTLPRRSIHFWPHWYQSSQLGR